MATLFPLRGGWPFPGPPNCAFTLNTNSPQAQGLVGWWSCFGQNRGQVALRDMLGRHHMTAYNTPTIGGSEWGPAPLFDNASNEYLATTTTPVTAFPFTLAVWFQSDETGWQTLFFVGNRSSNSEYHYLYLNSSKANLMTYDGSTIGVAQTTATYTTNAIHHACGVVSAEDLRTDYLDGGNAVSNTSSSTPDAATGLSIGVRGTSSLGRYLSGNVFEARIYNRALSDAEIAQLYAPQTRWDLYRPLVPWLPVGMPAGGGYSLDFDAGSYTLTGQDATLLATRALAADAGSYTLSGQDAALLASRLLTADAGSYTLSGQDATLTAARLLEAAAGSYTLTGLDATLDYSGAAADYTLNCDAGSYSLTGQDAGLIVSRILLADAGVYTLTGQDAAVLRGYPLAMDAGSYTITGQDAALVLSRVLELDAGSYTLNGRDVSFVYSGATPITTPDGRVYVVAADDRIYVIAADSRAYAVEADDRTYTVEAAS